MMCSIQLVLLRLSAREEGWEGWRGGVTLGSVPMRMVWGLPLKKGRAHWWVPRRGEMWIRTTVPTPPVRWTHRKGFLLPLLFLLLFLFLHFLLFFKVLFSAFPSFSFLPLLPAPPPASSSFSFLSLKSSRVRLEWPPYFARHPPSHVTMEAPTWVTWEYHKEYTKRRDPASGLGSRSCQCQHLASCSSSNNGNLNLVF